MGNKVPLLDIGMMKKTVKPAVVRQHCRHMGMVYTHTNYGCGVHRCGYGVRVANPYPYGTLLWFAPCNLANMVYTSIDMPWVFARAQGNPYPPHLPSIAPTFIMGRLGYLLLALLVMHRDTSITITIIVHLSCTLLLSQAWVLRLLVAENWRDGSRVHNGGGKTW